MTIIWAGLSKGEQWYPEELTTDTCPRLCSSLMYAAVTTLSGGAALVLMADVMVLGRAIQTTVSERQSRWRHLGK